MNTKNNRNLIKVKAKRKVGIASFILSLIPLPAIIVIIIIGLIIEENQGPDEFTEMILGGTICLFSMPSIISISLGIVGLVQKEAKLFNILGIVISLAYLLMLLIFMIIGIAIEEGIS